MKKLLIAVVLPLWLLSGCIYDVPLTVKTNIPIKKELLGLWEFEPAPEQKDEQKFTMLVLGFNNNEYVIRYGEEADIVYLRAYHVKLDDLVSLIQIQCIGSQKAPLNSKDTSVYDLVKYKLEGDNLTIEILNPDVIDKNCKSSRELRKKILANKNNKKLFYESAVFKKVN